MQVLREQGNRLILLDGEGARYLDSVASSFRKSNTLLRELLISPCLICIQTTLPRWPGGLYFVPVPGIITNQLLRRDTSREIRATFLSIRLGFVPARFFRTEFRPARHLPRVFDCLDAHQK